MSFRVQLTAEALRNQNEMADWIMQRSVAGALAWLDALDRVLRQVSTSPLSFPIAAEDEFSHQELRNALFGTRKGRVFRAIFFVDGDRVIVTHLRGPAQQALSYDGKRPGILFVPTAFRFTDPLRGGGQRRRFCRHVVARLGRCDQSRSKLRKYLCRSHRSTVRQNMRNPIGTNISQNGIDLLGLNQLHPSGKQRHTVAQTACL